MKEIGTIGEKLIERWLQIQNYAILERNWHCRWGEIDLIVQAQTTSAIAFVEVKTRSQNNWDENGLLAINSAKQQKIWTTASLFLTQHPQLAELPCRFDVALVSYQITRDQKVRYVDDLRQIQQLNLGQPINLPPHYQLTIENYLISAFD